MVERIGAGLGAERAGTERADEVSVEALARLGASAAWHTTSWAARTSLGLGRRVLRAATSAEEASDLARDMMTASRVMAEGVADVLDGVSAVVGEENGVSRVVRAGSLGAHGVAETLAQVMPERGSVVVNGTVVVREESKPDPAAQLRRLGQALLERSRDVWTDDEGHPAYEQILTQLAPDEARILLLLLRGGPQPSVDVRTGGPIGMVSSQLIAPGLTMIGSRCGCRHLERVPAYLNNLHRLGLVWFSHEPLADPMPYQVLEAQPDVLAAMHSVRFPKVVRRSIHLTPFGEDFCRAALITPEETDALPAHQVPDAGGSH
ncbi:Abi-alpha family protein [Nocardioides massiliensis]|uniref:DUF4393 domain-containing protein n=1 Tax=Nocardioides massiliensis TaxID=1325935 RepID=A0ABT9NMC1_9ACTN|nr:Abi-alpha family protein [Nocardioides massiliensis]MDP9821538.1 hypothetical protein [Nocardioides massiliensis]